MSNTDLRRKLIRLAHANPSLRPHLLPILKKSRKVQASGSVDALLDMYASSVLKDILTVAAKDLGAILSDEEADSEGWILHSIPGGDMAQIFEINLRMSDDTGAYIKIGDPPPGAKAMYRPFVVGNMTPAQAGQQFAAWVRKDLGL